MLNNNFVMIYKALLGYADSNNYKYPINDISGESRVMSCAVAARMGALPNSLAMTLSTAANNSSACVLALGSGTKEATTKDYAMEELITDGIEVISQTSAIYTTRLDSSYGTVTRQVKNISGEAITIREIGLMACGGAYDWDASTCLIAREVLPEPFVLEPGKKHSFTLNLCIDSN